MENRENWRRSSVFLFGTLGVLGRLVDWSFFRQDIGGDEISSGCQFLHTPAGVWRVQQLLRVPGGVMFSYLTIPCSSCVKYLLYLWESCFSMQTKMPSSFPHTRQRGPRECSGVCRDGGIPRQGGPPSTVGFSTLQQKWRNAQAAIHTSPKPSFLVFISLVLKCNIPLIHDECTCTQAWLCRSGRNAHHFHRYYQRKNFPGS